MHQDIPVLLAIVCVNAIIFVFTWRRASKEVHSR